MSLVRNAKAGDRLALVALLRDAHTAAALPFAFSAPHALALVDHHMGDGDAVALVLDTDGQAQGVLLATAKEHPFAAIRYASETAWYIAEHARGGRGAMAMLAAFEAWASDQGCVFAGMAALTSAPRAETIYRRRGYRAVETHFLKPLI